MKYTPNSIYHIYNQGTNRQIIFPQERNYIFFLEKIRKHLLPCVDILAYCLMPNHFHLLVYTNEKSCSEILAKTTGLRNYCQQKLSKEIGCLLSGYTKAINRQEDRTGALFRSRTKQKECFYEGFRGVEAQDKLEYASNCFQYIHNNPVVAKMVILATDWEYSSAKDYAQFRSGTLCQQTLANQLNLVEK
jgi:putative transposase